MYKSFAEWCQEKLNEGFDTKIPEDLVTKAKYDPDAMDELLALVKELANKVVYGKIDPNTDEDIVQNTVIDIYKQIKDGKINNPKALEALVIRTVKGYVFLAQRSKRRHAKVGFYNPDEDKDMSASFEGKPTTRYRDREGLSGMIDKEDMKNFEKAYKALDATAKAILDLERSGNKNVSDIARQLGISVGVAHNIRRRALGQLKSELNPLGENNKYTDDYILSLLTENQKVSKFKIWLEFIKKKN